MPSNQFKSTSIQHICHTTNFNLSFSSLGSSCLFFVGIQVKVIRENFLDINPLFEVQWEFESVKLGLSIEVDTIKITTWNENESWVENSKLIKVLMKSEKGLLVCGVLKITVLVFAIAHFVCDACELCAKRCNFVLSLCSDISMEFTDLPLLLYIYNDNR